MTRLSDGLPEGAKREYIQNELKPGCVLRLEMKFPDKSKPKFMVLVADDDADYWSFFINTAIHPFIQSKPHLLQCQVKVDAASNPFLDYDSHLGCHEVIKLRKEEVIRDLMRDTSGLKGSISKAVQDEILAAVKFAKTLSPNEKRKILDGLA